MVSGGRCTYKLYGGHVNFKEYIELHRKDIYSKISEYVSGGEPSEHYNIMKEYSDRQGSYRRPGLLMLSGEMFGAKPEELLLPAAAMQLSEDWILMHDDVEDDSEMRRGKPALHRMYGANQAINAGDGAHMAMWKILKDYIVTVGLDIGNAVYDKFYDMLEKTVIGQYMDIKFIESSKDLGRIGEDLYFSIVEAKTAYYTVYGPMQIGAMLAGRNDLLDTLKDIGRPAGIAFQIVDDILDIIGDEKSSGKKRYGDLYEGKLTLIILHAYRSATDDEKKRIDAIYNEPRRSKTVEEISFLAETIDKYSSIEYAKEVAGKYSLMAKESIGKYSEVLPHNAFTEVMFSAIEELYIRKK